jgi:redox-sensitive bicupin YhaK (pirin superfamily)
VRKRKHRAMATKIVLNKEQLTKESYHGAIREQKILGFPQEKSPLKPYSTIFYWSRLISDYGYLIPQQPHIGFEIFTYVLRGGFEVFNKELDQWWKLSEGDICVVKAGRGILHTEKLLPRSEILQIWFDPDFEQNKKNNPELFMVLADSSPIDLAEGHHKSRLIGENAALKLNSKNVAVDLHGFYAGFYTIGCPEDTILSGYVLDGYIEIDEVMLGKNDFFKVDEKKEIKIASLVNSKIIIISSPYKPVYQTYATLK